MFVEEKNNGEGVP